MNAEQQSNTTITTKPLSYLGCLSIILALASPTTAFQSARGLQVSLPSEQVLTRPSTRTRTILSHRRGPAVSTTLQYRDGSDESDSSSSRFGWLNTIFSSSQQTEDSEQQFVDEYLEFLDRRYRRLHTSEEEEAPKPFSALGWLKQGSPSRNDVIATQQQQEDALFVLGVAGLASRKLLQKHHLHVEADNTVVANHNHMQQSREIVDVDVAPSGPLRVLIQRLLVPVLRVLYVAQRRKNIFVGRQMRQMKRVLAATMRSTGRTIAQGPLNAARAVLEIGGGKKTLAMTLTTMGTMLIVIRPILKAIVTEGAVHP